ncbi:MAG: phytanoyl-CoA dioxygenase family protein [Actinomycetes bacterium]
MSTQAATFSDPAREAEYRANGFVVMPLLTDDEVGELLEFYWSEVHDPDDHGLTVDHMRDDRGPMARIAERTRPLWERVMPRHFAGHESVFTTFVVKHPGLESQMRLHDDLSWVDETRFRSGTMWVPLVDVGPSLDNGALGVVPRSHELGIAMGGNGTPDLIRPYEAQLLDALVEPSVPAGSAVYYDSRTLHGSRPNLTATPRVAIACGVVPAASPLLYVLATGRRRRVVFQIDPTFYVEHSPRQVAAAMPSGYPTIDEYVDDLDLAPSLVDAVAGRTATAGPSPVVPWELWPREQPPTMLSPSSTGVLTVDDDVVVEAVTVVDSEAAQCSVGGWDLDVTAGDVGRFDVEDLPNTVQRSDAVLSAAGTGLVLAPWSRCTLTAGPMARLTVVDGARVAVGICDGSAAANPNPGDQYELHPSRAYQLWNDGPGPFTVVVEAGPSAPPERGRRHSRWFGRGR